MMLVIDYESWVGWLECKKQEQKAELDACRVTTKCAATGLNTTMLSL